MGGSKASDGYLKLATKRATPLSFGTSGRCCLLGMFYS